jgi:hypothetical protein
VPQSSIKTLQLLIILEIFSLQKLFKRVNSLVINLNKRQLTKFKEFVMGQQYKKVVKRKRRKAYLVRVKALIKSKIKGKSKTAAGRK